MIPLQKNLKQFGLIKSSDSSYQAIENRVFSVDVIDEFSFNLIDEDFSEFTDSFERLHVVPTSINKFYYDYFNILCLIHKHSTYHLKLSKRTT
jgi:hypothetical protein